MYTFDPSLLQIVLAAVTMLSVGFVAAWAVVREGDSGRREAGQGDEHPSGAGSTVQPLDARQKVILWTAAGAAALFLLWWATLPTGSGGAPAL